MKWLTQKISRRISDAVIAPYASSARTLEIGAYGNPSYARFFPNRTGIDIKSGPGVDVVASVYALPFSDGEFDTVLCISVLEHLEEPGRAIAEIKRVLKSGGHAIVSVPFLFPIHDAPGDYWRFTKFGLQYLFREGWHIEHLSAEADAQTSLAILIQRFGYQTRLHLNFITKAVLFCIAQALVVLPRLAIKIFGDIHKKHEEPDAFAGAFFLVARKQ